MSLTVKFDNHYNTDTKQIEECWMVCSNSNSVASGFGRRKDAEIAKWVLENLAVDWSLPYHQRADATPNKEERKKLIAEHLQW